MYKNRVKNDWKCTRKSLINFNWRKSTNNLSSNTLFTFSEPYILSILCAHERFNTYGLLNMHFLISNFQSWRSHDSTSNIDAVNIICCLISDLGTSGMSNESSSSQTRIWVWKKCPFTIVFHYAFTMYLAPKELEI